MCERTKDEKGGWGGDGASAFQWGVPSSRSIDDHLMKFLARVNMR